MARRRDLTRPTLVRAAGVGLVGLGLVLSGCSSNDTADPAASTSPTSAVASTEASPDASGETVGGVAQIILEAGKKTVETGSARFDVAGSRKGLLDSSATGTTGTFEMNGFFDFTSSEFQATLNDGTGAKANSMELMTTGGSTYLRSSALGTDKWLRVPAPPDAADSLTDPTKAFDQLANLKKLKEEGTEEVDGAKATKYSGISTLGDALKGLGIPESELKGKKISGKSSSSVWIDEEGRIIQVEEKLEAKIGKQDLTSRSVLRFSDFGVEVNLEPPPADQVADLGDLSQSGQ